ncbi:CDP-diacylglycerol--serine O-phosphatidyltransferase [Pleomorphovibrio marinus]|uniref:CDP-diacylglycerol--serine O-phosphatidyltransferase n=1 Tax=Pleomorphovibrio marinus TaxID=2164132 RepID=UPI000E0BBFD9|nr:CDP-diacylglycerol--serine O-phosphatidyltransferase [Pleomorphovibrio marinus]
MNIKSHIPNAITCLNLLAGMIGIYLVIQGKIQWAAYVVLLAALFDFLDGLVARLLSAHSEIGKQLDSLADMVTFGVLPSFMVFMMLKEISTSSYTPYIAFLIGTQSALRLAKFNVDTRQSERFIGLPTPANALFFCTLPQLMQAVPWTKPILLNPVVFMVITLLFAFLLTAEIPLIALKFKNFSLMQNIYRYLVMVLGLISVLIVGIGGIPFVILLYILFSLLENWLTPGEFTG